MIRNSIEFQKDTKKVSQYDYYVNNNADATILSLVRLNNKAFGELNETCQN